MASVLDIRYSGSRLKRLRQKRMVNRALKLCTFDLEKLTNAPGWRGPIRVEWNNQTELHGKTYPAVSLAGWPNYINLQTYVTGRKYASLFIHELGHQIHHHFLPGSTYRARWIEMFCCHEPRHGWGSGPYTDQICEAFAEAWKVTFSPFPAVGGFIHPVTPDIADEMHGLEAVAA